MPYHDWGDEEFDWNSLYKAQSWFVKLYEKVAGKYPMTKEKYGTIRFEYTYLWIENEHHFKMFKECVRRTVKRFPQVAGEFASDAGHVVNDEYFNGWCAGVTFLSTGSYWSSDDRPKGV